MGWLADSGEGWLIGRRVADREGGWLIVGGWLIEGKDGWFGEGV